MQQQLKDQQRITKKKARKPKPKEWRAEDKTVTCSLAGNRYVGTLRKDVLGAWSLEGVGEKYTWESGVQYEGSFVNSEVQGRGKFVWPDGSSYEGEVSKGKRHGEGVLISADGITRFEGQWHAGKRHGHGRLTYDAAGEAYYEGQWEDGKKHGEGKQVWASKNVYEGQWRYGKMAGSGTMTWRDRDPVEQYTGNWEDNHPEGIGKHTWFSSEANQEKTVVPAAAAQQMNNCYEGEWHNGIRHGMGTFSYASGAKYHGNWDENVKEGDGRYTFEDGQVYAGGFKHDQMASSSYALPATSNGRVMNTSNLDNPIKRSIDISDLRPSALPVDAGPFDFAIGTGYLEEDEVMREVHNVLLRHLADLKHLYASYRGLAPRSGADPFVLSTYQFWVFCRDLGLLTPSCSLSRLNRCVTSGKRHHQEAAFEDMEDLRPLTPRGPEHRTGQRCSELLPEPLLPDQSMESDGLETGGQTPAEADDEATGSSPHSTASLAHDVPEIPEEDDEAEASEPNQVEETALPEDASYASVRRPPSQGQGSAQENASVRTAQAAQPPHTKFRRREGSPDLVNIHSPAGFMLFRHFLESIVRLALARFPRVKSLEHQVRRLFKDCIIPNLHTPSSLGAFSFLLDNQIEQVVKEFQDELWAVFKENAVGEGAYEQLGGADTEVDEPPGAGGEKRDAPPPVKTSSRSIRRGFAGQQRRLHVAARQDVTVRLKDVLKLFDTRGLLQPLKRLAETREALPTRGPVFPVAKASEQQESQQQEAQQLPQQQQQQQRKPSDASSSAEKIQSLQGLEDLLARPTANAAGSQRASARSRRLSGVEASLEAVTGGRRSRRPSKRNETLVPPDLPDVFDAGPGREPLAAQPAEEAGEPVEPPPLIEHDEKASEAALKTALQEQCDMSTSCVDLVRLALEICHPEGTDKLFWSYLYSQRLEEGPEDDCLALLDYLETELCFTEFLRLLLRVAELRTEHAQEISGLPLSRRLAAFLRHTFVPAKTVPYKPPVTTPPPSPPVESEASVERRPSSAAPPVPQPEPQQPPQQPPAQPQQPSRRPSKAPASKAAAKAGGKAGSKQKEEPRAPTPEVPPVPPKPPPPPPPPPKPEFWEGFQGDAALDWAAAAVPRAWVSGYAEEVQDW